VGKKEGGPQLNSKNNAVERGNLHQGQIFSSDHGGKFEESKKNANREGKGG